MGSCGLTGKQLTTMLGNILLATVLITVVHSASIYPAHYHHNVVLYHNVATYPMYYQAGPVLPPLQPPATTRQGILNGLFQFLGDIVPQVDDNDTNERPNEDHVITPEDAQAIWISGFPIARTSQHGLFPVLKTQFQY